MHWMLMKSVHEKVFSAQRLKGKENVDLRGLWSIYCLPKVTIKCVKQVKVVAVGRRPLCERGCNKV